MASCRYAFKLAFALFSSCAFVGTALRRAVKHVEVVHPGHPAVYTARLLRNEHAGMVAMLESEARWQQPAQPSLLEEVESKAPVAQPGLKLSARQIAWLAGHQQQALAEGLGAAGSLLQELDESTPTALKLSSLQSEYVGPIGVGSVYSSEACASAAAEGAQSAAATSQDCKADAQASVWVVFDTGSTNLWVNSDACTEGACAQPGRIHYNHSASTSYREPEGGPSSVAVTFGTGNITGQLANDDFHVGPVTLHNQTFGMIQKQEGSVFERFPIEGILGLAFPSLAANGTTPFFDNVISQHVLAKNEVSFYFSLNNPSANAMLWGGVDSKFHTTPIEYFKVTKPYYWGLDLKAFQIRDKDMLTLPGILGTSAAETGPAQDVVWEAIIDTGTTYWTAPTALFRAIMGELQESPCSQMTEDSHPPITFRFENTAGQLRDFTLTSDQYMVSNGEEQATCRPAFMSINMRNEHEHSMLFGEVFLRHFFSVFDRVDGDPQNARVGFAKAAQGEETDDHLKSITKDQPLFSERHSQIEASSEE